MNFSGSFFVVKFEHWACSVLEEQIQWTGNQRPPVAWANTSVLVIKLTVICHAVSLAQTVNSQPVVRSNIFPDTGATQRQPLFFPLYFSSSFWNQSSKKVRRTIDAATAKINRWSLHWNTPSIYRLIKFVCIERFAHLSMPSLIKSGVWAFECVPF